MQNAHCLRVFSSISTVKSIVDDSFHVITLWFSCDVNGHTIITYNINNVLSVFSLCQVKATDREHVQLVEVDAPDVAHFDVDGTPEHVK